MVVFILAGSRSMSPSGKSTQLTQRERRALFLRSMSARTGASRIPRSQGHSREMSRDASRDGSPSRSSARKDFLYAMIWKFY